MADNVLTVGPNVARLGAWFRLNQRQWGEELGVDRSTIASYKNVAGKGPSRERLKEIAESYGVPLGWFYGPTEGDPPVSREIEEAKAEASRKAREAAKADGAFDAIHPGEQTNAEEDFALNEYVTLPTWEGTIAGFKHEWHFDDGKTALPTEVPKYMLSRKHKERFIVCKPKGASMAPRIQQGDIVLVRLESNPAPGEIIIARNESGQNFIKVYRIGGRPGDEVPELHSINGQFPRIAMEEEWTCKGVVVGIRKPYITEGLNEEFRNGSPLRA